MMTLSGAAVQSVEDLQVVVSSQGRHRAQNSPVAQALGRIIELAAAPSSGTTASPRGIAEQRHLLRGRAKARSVLFFDDDVFMERFVIARLLAVLNSEGCDFVGAFWAGLNFSDDVRPDQQRIELWEGPVQPASGLAMGS